MWTNIIPTAHAGTLIPDLNATSALASIGQTATPFFNDLFPYVLFIAGFLVVALLVRAFIGAFHR